MKKTDKPGCIIPFNALTIGPSGDVLLCCVSSAFPIGHISEISDLQELFESELMEKKRQMQYSDAVLNDPACSRCYKDPHKTTWKHRTGFQEWYNFDQNPNKKIKYLEFSTSNICNQACSMCGPKFSNKWNFLVDEMHENKFYNVQHSPLNKMDNESIGKIKKLLPYLEVINIKGGEPFADPTNFEILEELIAVNSNCKIEIISNLRDIPENILNILKNVDRDKLSISASIDGVGPVYEWIRSSSFEQTVDTMEKIYLETKHNFGLIPSTSIHNFFTGDLIAKYFIDKPYIRSISYSNPVRHPQYCDHLYLTEKLYYEKIEDYLKISKHPNIFISNFILNPVLFRDVEPHNYEQIFRYIDVMNEIRGIDLYEHTPELREFKKNVL
jgi:MoaA/NifB/PqqE/SkfB family radical SAM enzyme